MESFKILVLMSTYNGEKYLINQIESIFNQKCVKVSLLIRDDGSTDNTIMILEEIKRDNPNIDIIKGCNCGSAQSFMNLVHETVRRGLSYSYYAFADQDDIWLEDKLLYAIKALERVSNSIPSLYMGAYQMVDSSLRAITTILKEPTIDLPHAMASNSATGCTMVFNRKMLEILGSKFPKDIIMHDYWAYLVCLISGGHVHYDKVPHILYRQHDNNVIGGQGDPFFKKWFVRFRKFFKNGDMYKSRMASQLLLHYSDIMNIKDRCFLESVSTCRQFKSRLILLKNKKFKGLSLDKNLQLIGLIITGKL